MRESRSLSTTRTHAGCCGRLGGTRSSRAAALTAPVARLPGDRRDCRLAGDVWMEVVETADVRRGESVLVPGVAVPAALVVRRTGGGERLIVGHLLGDYLLALGIGVGKRKH